MQELDAYKFGFKLYSYYLTEKDVTRLEEVLTIVTELANSWKSIEPN